MNRISLIRRGLCAGAVLLLLTGCLWSGSTERIHAAGAAKNAVVSPSGKPSQTPKSIQKPTSKPTVKPTVKPSATPTAKPSATPSAAPSVTPSAAPSQAPAEKAAEPVEEPIKEQAPAAAAPEAPEAAVPSAATQAEAPAPKAEAKAPAQVAGVIFVGDSRFVQMHDAVGDTGVTWICQNSKGCTWFHDSAVDRIDRLTGKGTKILINLGVNDANHYNDYIPFVNAKAAEWTQKGATVYYASVNPVWENPYTTEEEVETFNAQLSANLVGVNWIDSHSYLVQNGYRILDGLHYSDETYLTIYNYYISAIQ